MNHNYLTIPRVIIPRVRMTITPKQIKDMFEKQLQFGEVKRVTMYKKKTSKGTLYQEAHVSIDSWFKNENASYAHETIYLGSNLRVADGNNYIVICPSYGVKSINHRDVPFIHLNTTIPKIQMN